MLQFIILASLSMGALQACHQANREQSNAITLAQQTPAGTKPPIVLIEVGKDFLAGQFFEAPIDPTRELAQVTVVYSGSYGLPVLNSNGSYKVNDEGQTYYRDGMYAQGYVVNDAGVKAEIARKKFVDSSETDNWHDLYSVKGSKLRIEFSHSPTYANDADVKLAKRSIYLSSIKLQYKDDPRETYKEYRFAKNDQDEFAKDAIEVKAYDSYTFEVPGKQKIYRIDVRWGDAKPRVNGVYDAGMASGTLSLDGVVLGGSRNVAAIESQVWLVEDPALLTAAEPVRKIKIAISGDKTRIFWIRVYSKP